MANTIAIVPGAGIASTLGNLLITVFVIVLFAAASIWVVRQIPTIGTSVPNYPA